MELTNDLLVTVQPGVECLPIRGGLVCNDVKHSKIEEADVVELRVSMQ